MAPPVCLFLPISLYLIPEYHTKIKMQAKIFKNIQKKHNSPKQQQKQHKKLFSLFLAVSTCGAQ